MLYGYVRVSTDKQTVENQKLTITNYVQTKARNNQHINRVSETESGTKSYKQILTIPAQYTSLA
jgi:DNA invertase Pin-like site-specific DNA recombinase